jgi:hypothetical protein
MGVKMKLTPTLIEKMIYVIREQKVMLDSDLAELYGVETKAFNQAVKRNLHRFPVDFMFQPNINELTDLRSQIVTLGQLSDRNYFRHSPRLFTESGVAMLSSILNSETAIAVNISIMRTFIKVRSVSYDTIFKKELDRLEKGTNNFIKIVFERLDNVDEEISQLKREVPTLPHKRKKIGLKK